MNKRILSLAISLVLILALLPLNITSAVASDDVIAILSPTLKIMYNGEEQILYNVDGTPIYPILYNGRTYLPVRALCNMLGFYIEWDQANNRAVISEKPIDGLEAVPIALPQFGYPRETQSRSVNGIINHSIEIYFNSTKQHLINLDGTPMYPITIDGRTYLPLRAVAGILQLYVEWDQENNAAVIYPDYPPGISSFVAAGAIDAYSGCWLFTTRKYQPASTKGPFAPVYREILQIWQIDDFSKEAVIQLDKSYKELRFDFAIQEWGFQTFNSGTGERSRNIPQNTKYVFRISNADTGSVLYEVQKGVADLDKLFAEISIDLKGATRLHFFCQSATNADSMFHILGAHLVD